MTSTGHRVLSSRSWTPARLDRRRLLQRSLTAGAGIPLLGAAGPTRVARAQANTLTVAANWAPTDIDPHGGYDPGSGLVMAAIYESLIRQAPGDGVRLEPWLAESWEPNDDFGRWTFHLREGVTFQDGSPLTAEGVRASFERLFALKLAPANVLGRFITSADQIVTVDERTVRFDLDRPQRRFDIAMAAPFGTGIINVAAALEHDQDGDLGHAWCQSNSDGLGTGPYRLTSYDPQVGAVLERYPDYWGGWAGNHFERIVTRVVAEAETRRELIERGEADLVENISLDAVDDLSQNADVVVDRQTDLTVRYLAIAQAEPFVQPEARQALCWAFPYDEVLQGVFLGYAQPAQGAVSTNCAGFAPTTSTFSTDLEQARALLAQAGVPEGTRIQTVVAAGAPVIQSIAELYQQNLQEIGIELDIQQMDFASYVGMAYGDLSAEERPHLLPSFWGPDYDDAWSQLWPLTSCDAWRSGNIGHYCDEQVDALLTTANEATDQDTYLESLAGAQEIVGFENPTGIYFALPEWITILRRDIGGFQLHPVVSSRLDYYALYRTE